MSEDLSVTARKADHIRINLEEDVQSRTSTGLQHYRFTHQALPEINLASVRTEQVLFGRKLMAPLLISSMTGGTPQAAAINQNLAEAAQARGIAMGVGSQRAALEHPDRVETFQVRRYAPDILLFANLGAVQLNYGYGLEHCQRAVDMIAADALILHLNPLQEALQPEGDVNFEGLLAKIATICQGLPVPVVVKEVGWGISAHAARQLADAGVAAIDVAGAGGTSWSQVEMHRIQEPGRAQVAQAFRDWGIPTAESIRMVRASAPDMTVFASGGLRDGIDAAKCIALGASVCGLASPFLKAAAVSYEETLQAIDVIQQTLRVCMFAAGAIDLVALQEAQLSRVDGD
ncbi:MAG TPA: type 2 isopentenyl-diphosphate Delta-isomerase [Anaerolineaceae bacterium]|nr:type 2 isopentenyl-diphosphate Delta-isomerase [Anaerolineaceae bacterium]